MNELKYIHGFVAYLMAEEQGTIKCRTRILLPLLDCSHQQLLIDVPKIYESY